MFHAHLQCCLWDLVDEGIDDALDRIRGETGATGITIGADAPPIAQVRPHAGVSPRLFRSEGGAQFQPDSRRYAGTRLRPVVAAWLRKSNPLAQVIEGARKRGLGVRLRTHGCLAPAVGERHPEFAVKDVFGDVRPRWLCPVNPDVGEYLRGLLQDLATSYALDGVELSGAAFPPGRASDGETRAFDAGVTGEWLHNLCFCESCRQLARRDGLDVESIERLVSAELEQVFRSGEPPTVPLARLFEESPVLAALHDWRCTQVAALLGTLRAACRCHLAVHRCDGALASAQLPARLVPPADTLSVQITNLESDALDALLASGIRDAGSPARVQVCVSAGTPPCPDAAALVRTVARAARAGIAGVTIEDYGVLPLSRLEWVQQAIRYARREAASGA